MEEALKTLLSSQQALTQAVLDLPHNIAESMAQVNHQHSTGKNLIDNMKG